MPSKHYFTVGIRVHENEWLACKTAAKLAGQTLSMWGRRAIVASLPEDLAQVAVVAKEVEDVDNHGNIGGPICDVPCSVRVDGVVVAEVASEAQASQSDCGLDEAEQCISPDSSAVDVTKPLNGDVAQLEEQRLPKSPVAGSTPAIPNSRTYSRNDLCIRCQRIGPSCGPCRALTRDRMPE